MPADDRSLLQALGDLHPSVLNDEFQELARLFPSIGGAARGPEREMITTMLCTILTLLNGSIWGPEAIREQCREQFKLAVQILRHLDSALEHGDPARAASAGFAVGATLERITELDLKPTLDLARAVREGGLKGAVERWGNIQATEDRNACWRAQIAAAVAAGDGGYTQACRELARREGVCLKTILRHVPNPRARRKKS